MIISIAFFKNITFLKNSEESGRVSLTFFFTKSSRKGMLNKLNEIISSTRGKIFKICRLFLLKNYFSPYSIICKNGMIRASHKKQTP
jgi:hypothetical protein